MSYLPKTRGEFVVWSVLHLWLGGMLILWYLSHSAKQDCRERGGVPVYEACLKKEALQP